MTLDGFPVAGKSVPSQRKYGMIHFPDWLMKRDWSLMKSLPAHQRLLLALAWAGRTGMHRGELAPWSICPLMFLTSFSMPSFALDK